MFLLQVSRASHHRFFTQRERLCQVKALHFLPPHPRPLLPHYLRDLPKADSQLADPLRFPHLRASRKQPFERESLQLTSSGGPREEEEEGGGGKRTKTRLREDHLMGRRRQRSYQETKGFMKRQRGRRQIVKRGGRKRKDGLFYHKRQHQEGATVCHSPLNKGCLLPPLPHALPPPHPHPRSLAPVSLDMSTIHSCSTASNSRGQRSSLWEVQGVREKERTQR